MRRGAILAVPNEWPLDFTKSTYPKVGMLEVNGHMRLLEEYGCSQDSLQWLNGWYDDFQMNSMLYRFGSSEDETRMPFWAEGSRAMLVTMEDLNDMCQNTIRFPYPYLRMYSESTIKNPDLVVSKGRRICRI